MNRTLHLFAALALCGCSAFGYQGLSAKHVGCPARDIEVSDTRPAGRATSWTATCRGKSYLCGGDAEGNVVCREKVVAALPPPPPPPAPPVEAAPPVEVAAPVEAAPPVEVAAPVEAVAPVEPVPAAAPAALGCQYDTQCKGDRLCVDGRCVDPPAAP